MASSQSESIAASRWHDRPALVTGASSGIGRAIARVLAEDLGMRVAVFARRAHLLSMLADEVEASTGHARIFPIQVDLRDEASILDGFRWVESRLGGVDIVVNNAGLGHDAPLSTGRTDEWREMLDVNVLALCICTREVLRSMRSRGVDDGHILHISSMAGHRVPDGSGVYSATKFAVTALVEGLRKELRAEGSNIRVSAVSPGFVETEFAANYHKDDAAAEETYGRFPVLSAHDVADAVRYVIETPAHVQIHDVLMRPTRQPS